MADALASTLELVGRALLERRPVSARYAGRPRLFCPHAIGRREGVLRVFAWQFGGETRDGDAGLPNWRCFDMAGLEAVRRAAGSWRRGRETCGQRQFCLETIELAVPKPFTTANLMET